MVFAMGTRLAWGGLGANISAVLASPEVQEVVPLWRFWKAWGIAEATMVGWWDEEVPVTTSDPMVKASVYVKPDNSMLIAIGNFGANATTVTLTLKNSEGGRGVGVKKAGAGKLVARAIEAYQPEREFGLLEQQLQVNGATAAARGAEERNIVSVGIPVQAKGGWLLERE